VLAGWFVKCERRCRIDLVARCPAKRLGRSATADRKSAEPGQGRRYRSTRVGLRRNRLHRSGAPHGPPCAQQLPLDGPLAHPHGRGDLTVAVARDLQREPGTLAHRKPRDELKRRARIGGSRRRGGLARGLDWAVIRRSYRARRIASRRATTRSQPTMFVRSGWRATSSAQANPHASSITCGRALTSRATRTSRTR
jgi:hypothetical protein